jgi:hypothetical protein
MSASFDDDADTGREGRPVAVTELAATSQPTSIAGANQPDDAVAVRVHDRRSYLVTA